MENYLKQQYNMFTNGEHTISDNNNKEPIIKDSKLEIHNYNYDQPTSTNDNYGTPISTNNKSGKLSSSSVNSGNPTLTAINSGNPTLTSINSGNPTLTSINSGNPMLTAINSRERTDVFKMTVSKLERHKDDVGEFKEIWDTICSALLFVILIFAMKYMSYLGLTKGTSIIDKIFSNWFNIMYGAIATSIMIGFILHLHDLYKKQTGKKNLLYYLFLIITTINYICELAVMHWTIEAAYIFSYMNLYLFYVFNFIVLHKMYRLSNVQIHSQNEFRLNLAYYILDFLFLNIKIFVFTFDQVENLQAMNISYLIIDIIFTIYQLLIINSSLLKITWSWDISFHLLSVIRTIFSVFAVILQLAIIILFSPYLFHIVITMICFIKTSINIQIINLNYEIK